MTLYNWWLVLSQLFVRTGKQETECCAPHFVNGFCPDVSVRRGIDLFRGACAVKGNVQVAGHVKPAPFSRRDVTLGDVDGSLFHIKI